jgi:alpha-tubulin suppressor-like RCC1 family protein
VANDVVAAAVGGNDWLDGQTFVTLSDGSIEAWGQDAFGQLCLGYEQNAVTGPVIVTPPPGVTWTRWASGGSRSYPLDANGNLWACGDNKSGEAGVGYMGGNVVTPTEVLSGVSAVSSTSRNVSAVSIG